MSKKLRILLAVLVVAIGIFALLAVTTSAEEKQITISFIADDHPFSTSTTLDKTAHSEGKITVNAGGEFTLPTASTHSYNGKEGYQLVWFTEDGRTYKAGETVSFTKDTKLFRSMFREVYTQEDLLSGMSSGSYCVMLMNDIEVINQKIGVLSQDYGMLNLNGYNLTATINGAVMGGQRSPSIIIGEGTFKCVNPDGKKGEYKIIDNKSHGHNGHYSRTFIGVDVVVDAPNFYLAHDEEGKAVNGYPYIKIYGTLNVYYILKKTADDTQTTARIDFMDTCNVTIGAPYLYVDYKVPTASLTYNKRAFQIMIYGGTFHLPAEAATEAFWSTDNLSTTTTAVDNTNKDLINIMGGTFILPDGAKPAIDNYLAESYIGAVGSGHTWTSLTNIMNAGGDAYAYIDYKSPSAYGFKFVKTGTVTLTDNAGTGLGGTYYYTVNKTSDGTAIDTISLYSDSAKTVPFTYFQIKRGNNGLLFSFAQTSEKLELVNQNGKYAVVPDTTCAHEYGAVVTDATCSVAKHITYTCSKCSHSYVENTSEFAAHDYKYVSTPVEATPTSLGTKLYKCSVCKNEKSYPYTIDPTNLDVTVKIRKDDGTFETKVVKASEVFEFSIDQFVDSKIYTVSGIKALEGYSVRNTYSVTIPVGILYIYITTENYEKYNKVEYGLAELIIADGVDLYITNLGNLRRLETIKIGNANVEFCRSASYFNPAGQKKYSSVLETLDISTSGATIKLGSSTFSGRSLKNLILGDGCVYTFGSSCFASTMIDNLDLTKNSQYTFGSNSFDNTQLTQVIIPDNATHLKFGSNVFNNCSKLTYFVVGRNFVIDTTSCFSGMTYVQKIVIMEGVTFASNVGSVFSSAGNKMSEKKNSAGTKIANIDDGTPLYVYNHSTAFMYNGNIPASTFNNCDGIYFFTVTDGIGSNTEVFKSCTDTLNDPNEKAVVHKAWTVYIGIPHSYDNMGNPTCTENGGIDCPCGVYEWNAQDGKWGYATFIEGTEAGIYGTGTVAYKKYESVHNIKIDSTAAVEDTTLEGAQKTYVVLAALGHDMKSVITNVTCYEDGEENLVCQREGCDHVTFVRVVETEGHKMTVTIVYANGFNKAGERNDRCENCDDQTVTSSAPAIFTARGYSIKNASKDSLNGGYAIDISALNAYVSANGELNFGIVVANANSFTGDFFVDGKVNTEKAIQVEIKNQIYSTFDYTISGFGANSSTLELVICAYVIDAEGNVSFIQAENDYAVPTEIGGQAFTKVTLDLVAANVVEQPDANVPSNDEE